MMKQIAHPKDSMIQDFCRRHSLDALILFGSGAAGTSHPQSDVDLAALPAIGMHVSKLHLIEELENIFGSQQIDLTVITENSDPLLLFEIFSSGKLVFESKEGLFEKNRLKAWHQYIDTLPLRHLEKTFNKERIRALRHVS